MEKKAGARERARGEEGRDARTQPARGRRWGHVRMLREKLSARGSHREEDEQRGKNKSPVRRHEKKKIEEKKSRGHYNHFILLVYHVKLFYGSFSFIEKVVRKAVRQMGT